MARGFSLSGLIFPWSWVIVLQALESVFLQI